MLHISMSHVAHINGSWHTCIKDANESVSLAPHNATVLCCKYESCRTFEGVMSHVWKSHIAQLNEYMCAHVSTMQYTLNDAIHSWVLRCISHNWKSHIAQLNESQTYAPNTHQNTPEIRKGACWLDQRKGKETKAAVAPYPLPHSLRFHLPWHIQNCSVLQCVAVCCCVLQWGAKCVAVGSCFVEEKRRPNYSLDTIFYIYVMVRPKCICGRHEKRQPNRVVSDSPAEWAVCYGVLQCVAVCCSVL